MATACHPTILTEMVPSIAAVDPKLRALYIGRMRTEEQQSMETEFKRLETLLDELIKTCAQLREENRSLRSETKTLQDERTRLLEKNELARNRVEAMIAHLRSMEQSS